MKRFTAFVLAVIVAFSFTSCGKESAEMYCYNCGNGVLKSDSFCSDCGTMIENTGERTTETTTESTTTATEDTTPTCTKKGFTTYICDCGYTYEDDYVNAKHNYSSYVCTLCGEIDKAHAYDYFVEWIKANGTVKGNEISIGRTHSGIRCDFIYNKSADYLYARVTNDGYELTLDLSNPNKNFKYVFRTDGHYATGTINAKTFTDDTVLPFDTYEGELSKRSLILEIAAILVSCVPIHMNLQFKVNSIDLTCRDMGFESYVY